jgi:hypothetical protein
MFVIMMLKDKHAKILLISGWLIVNIFLFFYSGFKYAIDTKRFDEEATAWLSGHFEFSYHFWYTGYILVLLLNKFIFGSIYFSIIFQCFLSLIATISFYNALNRLFKNTGISLLAVLPVILYYPIHIWNMYLLTESIYISLILFFVWAYSLSDKKKWVYMTLIAIIASAIRPNGGILLISCLAMYIYELWNTDNKISKRLIILSVVIGISSIILLLQYTTNVYLHFLINSFKQGEIICGYNGWTIPVSVTNDLNVTDNSISEVIMLMSKYPKEYLQLGIYRFIALWIDVRPYYSLTHNIYILISLAFLYIFAIRGLIQYRQHYTGLLILTVMYCILNSLLVMITYADWDGRFLAPLLPIISIWAGLGSYSVFKGFFRTKSTHL